MGKIKIFLKKLKVNDIINTLKNFFASYDDMGFVQYAGSALDKGKDMDYILSTEYRYFY